MARAPPVPISDSEKSMSAPEDETNDEQSGHKPRASFTRAMNNKVWEGAANKGPKPKATVSAEVKDTTTRAKTKKKETHVATEKAPKPKKKKVNKGKQILASASRRLVLDSDDEKPLPPKPITEPPQRSKKSSAPPTTNKPSQTVAADDASSSDDDSTDSGFSATGDNNDDLEAMEHRPEALIKALGDERPRWTSISKAKSRSSSQAACSEGAQPPSSRVSSEPDGEDDSPMAEDADNGSDEEFDVEPFDLPLDMLNAVTKDAGIHDDKERVLVTSKLLSMLLRKASHAIEDDTASKGYRTRKRTRGDEVESDIEEPPKAKAKSHRELALDKERPRFANTQRAQAPTRASTKLSKPMTIEELQALEQSWPEDARLVYSGMRKITKGGQSPVMMKYIGVIIDDFIRDYAFQQGIYPATKRFDAQRRLAIEAARRHGSEFANIKMRAKKDEGFMKLIVAQGEHRLTLERGDLKTCAHPLTAEAFDLDPQKPEDTKLIVSKLVKDWSYMYPRKENGTLDTNNPFDIMVIARIINEMFFDGPKSIASQNPQYFDSVSASAPDEKEMPEPMIALACAAIHSCLTDWSVDGMRLKKSGFSVSASEKAYTEALKVLKAMCERSPAQYHRVTHKVYQNVCALRDPEDGDSNGQNAGGAVGILTLEVD